MDKPLFLLSPSLLSPISAGFGDVPGQISSRSHRTQGPSLVGNKKRVGGKEILVVNEELMKLMKLMEHLWNIYGTSMEHGHVLLVESKIIWVSFCGYGCNNWWLVHYHVGVPEDSYALNSEVWKQACNFAVWLNPVLLGWCGRSSLGPTDRLDWTDRFVNFEMTQKICCRIGCSDSG